MHAELPTKPVRHIIRKKKKKESPQHFFNCGTTKTCPKYTMPCIIGWDQKKWCYHIEIQDSRFAVQTDDKSS